MADLEHYKRYGWEVSENNLNTLPLNAPQAAKDLAQWLTLEGRRKSLTEWLSYVKDDGRIHGKFWPIGTWTGRMAHTNPNQANIASEFHDTPVTPAEEIKYRYNGRMRALWEADGYLIGTDAEGIQLRLLAHYMKSQEYVDAICSGKKEDETDIHNMNKKALGSVCKDRGAAKTFIYAFLLGASPSKVADILGCTLKQATEATDNFLTALPGLKLLKDYKIPFDAARGFFTGLDGRKVKCDSTHLMLAGYLQNGEAVVMKHANILWRTEAKKLMLPFKQVDFVHDEWQTECSGTLQEAEKLGEVQREAIRLVGIDLGIFCPLAGSTVIGRNWKESH